MVVSGVGFVVLGGVDVVLAAVLAAAPPAVRVGSVTRVTVRVPALGLPSQHVQQLVHLDCTILTILSGICLLQDLVHHVSQFYRELQAKAKESLLILAVMAVVGSFARCFSLGILKGLG